MEKQTVKGVNKFFAAHIRKKRWHKAVTVLSCLVVFCTTYALILPAITMTGKPFCGKVLSLRGRDGTNGARTYGQVL